MGEGREGGFNSPRASGISPMAGRSAPGNIHWNADFRVRQEDRQGDHSLLVHPQTLG